ncbi:zinc finger protein 469 [Plectropomus leopardus]|uniref:zinc finger protein 469 n=1 Tax=Plectropomus leopardus TaxID=160734 RepID=UPI001C4B957A|nr:zinc finger protein 469 [Plectropomus leopardus]
MAGETQRLHAVKELAAESKLQDEGTALEQQSDKTTKESSEHFSSTGTEARAGSRGAKAEKLEKGRDCPQQREAVIRPQQTGKIDFRSLQNRSKFATDRTWLSGKGSPQSPSGKGRSREKGKRSGKTERGNPQQLYRLSITNPRSNPTIGIAYPQQKVTPPKKLETSRGPVSGSYRFHVPSIPEREAELQQEELNYSRCFQEASSNLTSPSYTSQALGSSSGTSSHPHPPLSQQQQPASMENNNAQPGSQLILADFQLSGSNVWQSPERTFNGANYGVSSQKSTALTEANKASAFVPAPFQYGYHFLEESTSDSFPCEQNPQSQDFTDSSLGSVHVTHNSFSFTPGEGQNVAQNSTQFSNEQQPEDRNSYSQPPQFIQGVTSSIQCPRNLSEDSASSDSSGSSSQQSEQGKTALPESTDTIAQTDSRDAAITSGSKRNCHPKDTAANQRTLIQGSVHHARNISGPGSQMHFPSKTFNNPPVSNIHTGSVPFDKNINNKVLNRLPHSWEGPNKTYSSADQNTIQYSDMNDKFQFQNQPALDQRPNSSKNSRMPWQQIRPTPAMPNQNRIELSRQISSQKLAYMVSPSDWQDDSKSHKHGSLKNPSSFQNSRTSDGFSNQRQETVKHSSNTVSTFKVEMSHAQQVCESKNKAVYFGLNQSLPAAASRNYSYPPLQVPPIGLMMVSPYESPLPSPVHNPASSSTCSSLSPASTSPVNISSEDSQMSKSAPPHPFYHQAQAKTQLPSDHLSSHPHQFHSDAPRNHPYAPERAKDDMMSYLQNSTHPKAAMDGNKGYMDSFGVEHHQPPPPYSAHQLLANSLAAANLDQLDVLLTCKQCDQNFNNLASFLGHKQYCAQHTFAQNDLKDISKMEDGRKFHTEPAKAASSVPNVSMSRCPSDLHLSLLGLNKNGELMSDSETKGDNKDDPMKLNLFSGPGNLPVPLPELEMEDAKLDSLITEALNGLGYQSDNAEIDSSFIDAFADDDLTTVKATSNKQCLKTKESLVFESKNKQAAEDDRSFTQGKYFYDSDVENPKTDKQYTESKLEKISLNLEQDEKINIKKEGSHKNSRIASREKTREQDNKAKEARKLCKSEDENTSTQRFLLSSKFSERCGVKSFQDSSALRGSTPSQASTSPTSRTAVKESKRKSTGGGTWSKELIHKIVQQKNKLHKLHVKGTKNLQFSLVMERLTPTVQNPAFGEYDYVSDSDDECEPVKIASQGRLNQSSRCKYTYTKECKWRARSERDQAAWRHESKECFEVKKSEEVSLSPEKHGSHQRLRRRGSRSSTSSELSTSVSVSSDSINSPKSTDRTDSDCEKKTDIKKKESPEQKTNERSSPQKLSKESSTLALTFTKSVKNYNTDKAILSDNKDSTEDPKKNRANAEVADPVSSSQKANDTIKNSEKGRSSHTKSREKLVSPRKEAVSSERNTLQRTDKLSPKEEPALCSSTDSKPLQFDSHSPSINKETDFNIDNTKGKRSEGPQATQPALSDSSTFEKQSDSVCMVKEAITLVNDLDAHKPASLCTSLMDEVCLSPTESQGPLIQKDTLHLMPYPLEQEQGLLKSPLSFDTSSMFGDLTGFDSGLYSDMPIQKDGFHSIESTGDKKEEFVSSFSPFLEQRDWNLIVSPVLPDEISQYKGSSEKSEKKPDYNHIPLSLPEKIIDYSANLNSCASEDELEIKRIVNELENQLQTTKLESPPLLAQDDPKQLKMSKFSPLRLSDESESEGSSLDMRCPVQTIHVPVTNLPSEPFTEPWSSPFQFELMGGHPSPHTPIHNEPGALEHFTEKEHDAPSLITTASHIEHAKLSRDQKSVERKPEKETAAETKEEILEQKRYTENLMKSLEVISDSIFKKEPIISGHKEPNVTSLTSQQHQEIECQASDAVEREDHSEKEAITGKENILSPPNINERKDDIEFILNESQSSLSNSSDPTVDGNQPISSQASEPTENNDSKTLETKATSEEDITENSNLIDSTCCSSVATHDPRVVEESGGNSNAADDVNQLFKNSSDGPEHSTTGGYEEAEAVKGITGQSVSHPLSPALPAASLDIGEKIPIKTAAEEQFIDNHDNAVNAGSSHADELKLDSSDCVNEEITVKTAIQDHLIELSPSKNCSPAKIYSPTTDLSVEIVTTDKPCSPILVETNTETYCSPFQDTQSTEGQSNLLILSQSDGIIDSDSCKVAPFNDSIKPETGLAFQKQDEILNVQDIKEHLPIDFMASHQNSPFREEGEESLFLHAAPPTSPLLSASPQTPMKKWSIEADSQSKCGDMPVNQGSIQNIQFPINKEENSNVNEALNNDKQLSATAEMEYSLISPPPLDLGIIECKIPGSETTISSPLPVTSTAEPAETSDGLEKRDPIYDFKLSPLNYNSMSDEPPQLNQYDYIPISPASKPEDNPDIKQSPRDDGGPCDLSVNPALIFNKADTDTVVSLDSEPAAKLNLSDEPLVLQQSLKFTCFSLGLPSEIKSKDSSTGDVKTDLEVYHDPAGPVANSHIHADLLRKDESENLDSHQDSAEDSTLIRKDISDGPPTPKPLVICENEQMPLPPDPSEKQPTIETGQGSTTHQVQKETTQKKTQNNTQQGKELCEICLMCFRTVPGLKRHKAMKHLVRSEKQIGPQSTTSSHQGTVLIYEASQTTEKEHKNDSQTCYPTKIDGLPETSSTLISKAAETESVLEEMPTETNVVAVGEIGHHNPLLPTKAKKNNKARKNKNSEANTKLDPFSDELLNIIKTDILKAISPEFKSSGPQELCKSLADQVKITDRTVTGAEKFPHPITSNSGSDNTPRSPTKDTNVLNETVELNQITDTEEIKCASMTEMANGEVCADNKGSLSLDKDKITEYDEPRKSLLAAEEMCEQRGSEQSLAQEILRKVAAVEIKCEKNGGPSDEAHPLSCLNCSPLSSPDISPDLKALLDDDTTFSQLFPRDEEAKRKKCPRVYSKRNKRQKLSPDSNVTQDCPPSETFTQSKHQHTQNQAEQMFMDNQTNRCEYETISIDDAIMLNMCHNSTLKSNVKELPDVKQSDQQDVHENAKEAGNSPSNPLESTVDKASIEWSGFDADSVVTSDPSTYKAAEPTAPCPVLPPPVPLPPTPFTVEPNATKNAQTFHSIDIQNINTTFQLPEIQFFDSKKDISVAPPVAAVDVESKDDEKSKKVTERRGRKRQVGGIKVKDKQYKCKVCFTWFLTLGELNFHKLSHNPSPPPTCYMCVQRKFSSREQLRDHLREKHAKNKTGIWTCGMCLKEISDVWMYNEHLREHATQFARRGQTQGSMLGIPGCFMQETAVKNFITSIMQHRPSKANRESSKATKEQEKAVAAESTAGEGKTSEGAEPKVHKTKSNSGAGGKQSTLTPLEVLHKTETPKSVEMHPNCKDPSRDCHHCGKQFPKPFKLQRHLVVHNLEKIFLCHKCPVSYQEAQELKGHLKRAHEEVDELDSKHTTLYTCELCADVMHVIKKSFICSTCNYTFSKKEQFDRHMEKHLSGGNKIFKFRGVLRPVKASASKENECESPASKKRRILSDSLQENSSDSGIASVSSLHLNQNLESSKPSVSTADDSTQTIANEYHSDTNDTNVKTEDIAEDYSELLVELEKCIHMDSSESASPKKEEIDPTTSPPLDKEGNGKSITESHDVKEENESVCIRAETASWSVPKQSSSAGEETVKAEEGSAEGDTAEKETDSLPSSDGSFVSLRENSIISKTPESKHDVAAEVMDQQRDDEQWHHTSKASNNDSKQLTGSQGAEQEGSSHMKEKVTPTKATDNTKNSTATSCTKATESTPVLHSKVSLNASASNEDKESVRPQKKRKDMKSPHSLQRVSSPATQENFGVDSRAKKKFRPSKCANPSLQRKSDGPNDYPVLASVRDDVVSNKIISKCKTSNLQPKRSLLDNCTQKKAEIVTPLNGDYKAKKGPLGRPLHPPISKVSSVPMNNSLNKSRPKMGVRSMESHSYRTAESQNHLLSQLFGQKLTSFKIPLRKDTSESIN